MQDKILNLFDPLCGWCYGFSQTILDFQDSLANIEFKAIPGGMITDSRVAPYHTMQEYILGAKDRLESMTGCLIGSKYIDDMISSDTPMDSTPPSSALITYSSFGSDTIKFAHELQKAHFQEGRDYNDEDTYRHLASQFGIDSEAFLEQYHSLDTRLGTKEAFDWVKRAGINGFPTVLYQSQDQYFLIARGYMPLEGLLQNLESAKKQLTAK